MIYTVSLLLFYYEESFQSHNSCEHQNHQMDKVYTLDLTPFLNGGLSYSGRNFDWSITKVIIISMAWISIVNHLTDL